MKKGSQKAKLTVMLLLFALSAGFPARAAAAQDKSTASQQDKVKACNDMAAKKGLTAMIARTSCRTV